MTFAEKLNHVARDDPKFASSVKRMRIASWVFGVGVAFAIGIGIWSVAVNVQQDKQITRIESPCLRYGSKSPQCKRAFEAAVATITHPQACAIERKAGTLQAIRELAFDLDITFEEPCAGARIAQERKRSNERAGSRKSKAGASQPAPTMGQQHAPAHTESATGGNEKVATGGGKSGQKPDSPADHDAAPTAVASPAPESTVISPESTESEHLPGKSGLVVKPVLEGAGKAVQDTGKVVGPLTCAATSLLNPCQP